MSKHIRRREFLGGTAAGAAIAATSLGRRAYAADKVVKAVKGAK